MNGWLVALLCLLSWSLGFTFAAWLILTAGDSEGSEDAAAHGAAGRGILRAVGGQQECEGPRPPARPDVSPSTPSAVVRHHRPPGRSSA